MCEAAESHDMSFSMFFGKAPPTTIMHHLFLHNKEDYLDNNQHDIYIISVRRHFSLMYPPRPA